jgi:ABC-type amino acid transport substrate-binding protein
MRPAFLPLLFLLLFSACEPAQQQTGLATEAFIDSGDAWVDVEESGRGVVRVIYVPSPGFAAENEAGELTGMTVEMMRMFASWLESERGIYLAMEFVAEPDWSTMYARVREGIDGVFGLGNVTITSDRREEVRFSPPYMTNVAVLITHEDVPELESMNRIGQVFADLDPLAYEGTLHHTRLQSIRDAHMPGRRIALERSNEAILERVETGDYFAYLDGYNFFRARDAGAALRHHPVANDAAEEFGIIMPRGSDWEEPLEAFFRQNGGFVGSPTYEQLLTTHLGQSVATELARATGRQALQSDASDR